MPHYLTNDRKPPSPGVTYVVGLAVGFLVGSRNGVPVGVPKLTVGSAIVGSVLVGGCVGAFLDR